MKQKELGRRPSLLYCKIRLLYKTVKNARRVVRRLRRYTWAMVESGFFREQSPLATERLGCQATRDFLLREFANFIELKDEWKRYYDSRELQERIEPVWEKMQELHGMKLRGEIIDIGLVREAIMMFFEVQ